MGVCLFSLQFLALMATTTFATTVSNPSTIKSLLSNARRLENQQNNGDEAAMSAEVEDYMMHYSIKLLHCHENESVTGNNNDDDGDYPELGVVVFRLCPSNSCSDNNKGCSSGYADFAISMPTFVAAYMDDQADNMQYDDDKFDIASFAQCAEYEGANAGDDDNAPTYYIGPACTSNGLDVKLDLFLDEYCSTKSTKAFSVISNGLTLPYADGGLVSTDCLTCGEQTDDGATDLKEMCYELYEDAPYKCEADWSIQHYYWDAITEIYRFGTDQTGCRPIAKMHNEEPEFSEWASLFFLSTLVIVTIVGAVFYSMWWKTKKESLERIDDEDEEDEDNDHDNDYHEHDDDDDDDDGDGQFA